MCHCHPSLVVVDPKLPSVTFSNQPCLVSNLVSITVPFDIIYPHGVHHVYLWSCWHQVPDMFLDMHIVFGVHHCVPLVWIKSKRLVDCCSSTLGQLVGQPHNVFKKIWTSPAPTEKYNHPSIITCFITYIQAVYYLFNKDSPEISVNKDRTSKKKHLLVLPLALA